MFYDFCLFYKMGDFFSVLVVVFDLVLAELAYLAFENCCYCSRNHLVLRFPVYVAATLFSCYVVSPLEWPVVCDFVSFVMCNSFVRANLVIRCQGVGIRVHTR